MRPGNSLAPHLVFVLSVMIVQGACTVSARQPVPLGQEPSERYDPAASVQAICRRYAATQHSLPYDIMYPQCMYGRGYRVPGFSPAPDSPGYQGELLGPATIGSGN
jgi:hypothetical protein